MATLAEIRSQYPQYNHVDDQTLADALYRKFYSHADRREFDARIGLKPYQNVVQAAGTAIQNIPASVERSGHGIMQALAEGVADFADPQVQVGLNPPLLPPGTPIEQVLAQPAPKYFEPTLNVGTLLGNVAPDVQRAIGAAGARGSLIAQLRGAEVAKRLEANPIDVAPGSNEEWLAAAAAGVTEMALPMAASVLARNPAPMAGYFGARSYGEGYASAREAGAGSYDANAVGSLYAMAEGVAEAIGTSALLKGGKTLVGSILKGAGVEGLTEGVTEGLQALVDRAYIDPDMTLEEARDRVLLAAKAGAAAGGVISPAIYAANRAAARGAETPPTETPAPEPTEDVVAVEDQIALPAPQTLLALPPPVEPAAMPRRQPPAPARDPEPEIREAEERDHQAQVALRRTKQAETAELLATARETITPLGLFDRSELAGPAAQRVAEWRARTGRPIDAPISVEDMARAKVPQAQIDAAILLRRPLTTGEAVRPTDIVEAAEARNIIATDGNFKELAFRTTGARDIERMSQAQLKALKSVVEAMPAHARPVTVPVAEVPPFNEGQYNKALDALRNQGRYTLKAIKDATGLRTDKDARTLRDAMVRRGQLVQRAKDDYRLYDVVGRERQAVPDDLPAGAFTEHVIKRLPVNRIRIRQDGKSLGTFGSAAEARAKVRELRAAEEAKGGKSTIAIEPAEEVAYGVMENRYDESGNLLGQVVVDTARDEAAAKALATQRNNPDTGARYTQTTIPTAERPAAAPRQPRPAPPPALAGRMDEVVQNLNRLARDRALPLLGTKVRITGDIRSASGQSAEGVYQRNLIEIASARLRPDMSTAQVVDALAQVMDHELIHALRGAGVLTPDSEAWKTLVRYVSRTKRPGYTETYLERAERMYAREPGYESRESRQEEAIAEAFRAWAANRRNVVGQSATVFRQIVEWFRNVLRAIPNDVFESIETGQMVRDALTPPGSGQPRAVAAREMAEAAQAARAAEAARDENAARVASRSFLRARAQAREDRFGRSGPKTVLGTTPTRAYDTGEIMDRDAVGNIVARYKEKAGISRPSLATYLPEDIGYMQRVADLQQKAVHDPEALDVAKAYRALINETRAMLDNLGDLRVERWTEDGPPYASPAEMLADIEAGRLRMRLSDDMFGPGADNPGHPMNAASGRAATDGTPLTHNDLFRAVHDVYGYGQIGLRGSPRDAYNAFHEHARLVSPEARRALATETLAQGAWHHYGPQLRRRDGTVPRPGDVDYLPPGQKEFAEQKAFLLPDEVIEADPGWARGAEVEKAASAPGIDLPKFSLADDRVAKNTAPSGIGEAYGDYITYTDKDTGAFMQIVERRGAARAVSVIGFEVPEAHRGRGVGRGLLGYVMEQHPSLMGQVSSRAAAKLAYDAGRRPWGSPDATLEDVFARIAEDSSVNLLTNVTQFDDSLPGGRLYGNPNRSPGGALSKPDVPSPAFTNPVDGARFFGGEMADEQVRMAREGVDGTTLVYLPPEEFLRVADPALNPEQEVYDALIGQGYKFSTLPSLVLDGYAGAVRVPQSDGAFAARALAGKARAIPVVLYPKRKENLGLVTAIEANGQRVPWPHDGRQENLPDERGPRYSIASPEFKRWFGDSKVVDENGRPRVVYRGMTREPDGGAFTVRDGGTYGEGIYLTTNRATAEFWANPDESANPGVVSEVFVSLQNPAPGAIAEDIEARATAERRSSIEMFRELGYDGVMTEEGEIVAFEPTQIKSAIANRGTYDIANPDIRYSLNAPFGTRAPRSAPDTMNIVEQRVEGHVGKVLADIGRSKRPIPLLGSVLDTRIKFQDRMLSVKEMIENIKLMDGKVSDETDVYMVEQLAGSRTVHQVEHRDDTLYEPLFRALRDANGGRNPVTTKEFEDYLYARHAPERNTYLRARGAKAPNPSGMSDAEAAAILDRFALDGKLPTLERLAAMADAISADTTKTRLDAGLISEKAANGSPYQFYIPLRGKAEEDLDPEDVYDAPARARSGRGYTVGGREDRAVTGRERKAGDLLSHLILQNTEAVIRAEKNRVAMSFMKLLADNPDSGYGKILWKAPTRMVVGANGMIREAGDPSYRQRPDIFTAKYKGAEIIAEVADPRVARAMRADYAQTLHPFLAGLSRFNRYLATVNTSLNPEFLITNLARDMQTAGLLGAQYDIGGLSGRIIKDAPAAMAGIREVLRNGTTSTPMARAFKELQDAGGTTEFLGIHDLDTHVERLRRDAASTGWNLGVQQARERITAIGKFIDDYNKVAENAFRLSAYKAARDAGASVDKAAFLAKNLTVNFNKGGENKALMNALYLFYNASISGTVVLLNGLKNKRVQKLVAGIVAAGVVQDLLNRALSGDEDDNGVKDYDDIPDYVLEHNWVFMLPGSKNYIALPMPYGFNVFHNAGRNMSNAFSGSPIHNPGKSAMSTLMTALNAFNPLGGTNSLVNFIAPTFADPIVDLATNKNFAGQDIVPERPSFGVPVPDSQKFWSNTHEIPKWIAAEVNRLGGGNEVRAGKDVIPGLVKTDISPETYEYVFQYLTGAAGAFVSRNVNLGMKSLDGSFDDVKISDLPFARRVVGTVGNRGNTERYYENAEEVETVAAEIKLAQETGDRALFERIQRENMPQVQLMRTYEKANTILSDMRSQIRDIKASDAIPADRKRAMIKRLQEEQDRIMAQLNKLYFSVANRAAP